MAGLRREATRRAAVGINNPDVPILVVAKRVKHDPPSVR